MRVRTAATELQERLRAERQAERDRENQAVDEIERKIAIGELKCPYCRLCETKVNRRTNTLSPCKLCARVYNRIKAQGYNLTLHDYRRMLDEQDNKCAICGSIFDYLTRRSTPNIDHCHELNHVRGLICGPCNTAIGLFYENEEILEAAIKYIKANRLERRWWFARGTTAVSL